jgi:hypothetical protein
MHFIIMLDKVITINLSPLPATHKKVSKNYVIKLKL